MHAKYIATPDDRETQSVTVYGVEFPKGEDVDISHLSDLFKAKLAGNPTFEVSGHVPAAPKASGMDDGGKAETAATAKRGAPLAPSGPEVDELRAKLDATGVKYHHMAGVPRLTAMLEAHDAASA